MGRQEEKPRADSTDGPTHGVTLVAAEIDGVDAPSRHRCAKVVSLTIT